jgi:hypothetical protein
VAAGGAALALATIPPASAAAAPASPPTPAIASADPIFEDDTQLKEYEAVWQFFLIESLAEVLPGMVSS